jgi:OOP family OmpA-OmpF porin
MKTVKFNPKYLFIALSLLAFQACKTKKLAQKPPVAAAPVDSVKKPLPAPKPAAPAMADTRQAAPMQDAGINLADNKVTIQFEFDSSVLRTDSYPTLDKVAAALRANPSVNILLKGYASSEGTAAHNMQLSVDRANSVRVYLTNTGVNSAQVKAKGYGIANPVADNSTEEGRVKNRRVEVRKAN